MAAGVKAVRLGRPDSVRPELLQYCPDAGTASSGDKAADYAAKLAPHLPRSSARRALRLRASYS